MADDLLNELNRNLKSAEELGNDEWAKALKKRISKLQKAAEPEEAPSPEKPSAASKKSKET